MIYAAVDVQSALTDALLVLLDDLAPAAIEERAGGVRVFFSTERGRDEAHTQLARAGYPVATVDVDDEDWARRSQESLGPVVADHIIAAPPWAIPHDVPPGAHVVVIQPSMGFGTGHHATTRLCLLALQSLDLTGRTVLDVGTGSGILAIASVALGASFAIGIDEDPDAIRSAEENRSLNPQIHGVSFQLADALAAPLPAADVVTANLTGAVLVRAAARLIGCLRPGATLIMSGLLQEERDEVLTTYARGDLETIWERAESGWVALAVKRS